MKLKQRNKTNMGLRYILFALFVSISFCVNAQQIIVKGIITASGDNMPIPGAAIVVKGTSTGATSDFDGNYSLKAKIGDFLEFTYLGSQDKTIKVTSNQINVQLESSLEDLDEVVVVGYGAIKKKEVTGAVAHVKAEDIEQFITTDVAGALQGQIAGVSVASSSGEPGSESSILIRGVTSISGNNEPLYVVDGIPQNGNPGLTPNEIQSIDVLKDGASTAVYGTRGAAGVILITTKSGEDGRFSVGFDTSYGIQTLGDGIPLMNTAEQIFYETSQFDQGLSVSQPGPGANNADWINNDNTFDQYVLNNSAETKTHTLNVTGGNKNITYNAVLGYFDQEGQIINSGFTRINGRISTTYKSENWRINGSLSMTTEDSDIVSGGLINSAIRYKPYLPAIDTDSDVVITNGNGAVTTPLNNLVLGLKRINSRTRDRINGSLSITRDFTKELSFTTRIGNSISNQNSNSFTPRTIIRNINPGPDEEPDEIDPTRSSVLANFTRQTVLSWDGSLNFKKSFGNHNLGLQGTLAIEERKREEFSAYEEGVEHNSVKNFNSTTVFAQATSGNNYAGTTIGILGRMTYDYKGKYLLSALIRRDGSSKFAPQNRWGNFPSISTAWNVSDEGFWTSLKSTINNLKIRASYGEIGFENFGFYESAATLRTGGDYIFDVNEGSADFGLAVYSYPNGDVQWETSISRNLGVDLAFLKNKIQFSADLYHTRKENMLFPVELPGSSGAFYDRNVTWNVGNMTNQGLELSARYRTKIGKSNLNIGATYSKNENEVTKMFGSTLIFNQSSQLSNGSGGTSVITVGREAGAFFLYETAGTIKTIEQRDAYRQFPSRANAQLGDLIYVDHNENGDIDIGDRHYHGSGLPDYELGFNFNWSYKGWDLSSNLFASIGAKILNGTKAEAINRERHRDLVNMWSPDNPTSNIPTNSDTGSGAFNYTGDTDIWVENGDFLRVKQITLGYSLPNDIINKIGITKLRMYLSAQNALTFTKYSGYDPEIGGSILRRGVDRARYPLSALYTLGFNLKF